MLNLKYKIGDVIVDKNNELWVIVYYDEETKLYNIQKIDIKQVSEYDINNHFNLIEVEENN